MKAGDLVRIKRAWLGVPVDTHGLIVDVFTSPSHQMLIYELVLIGSRKHPQVSKRRYIRQDLEQLTTP